MPRSMKSPPSMESGTAEKQKQHFHTVPARCYNGRMGQPLDFPIFDADNHLYETEDAFTRHLPKEHRNLFRFVELNGRKKLVIRNLLTDFIPNPTFEVVAAPGAHMAFYAADNPDGKSLREL